jgi:hypothetical protein
MQRPTAGTLQQLHPTGLWCQTGQRSVICCYYCLLVDACPCMLLLTSKALVRSHPCASLKRSIVSICPAQEVAEAEAGKLFHFTRGPTTGAKLAFTTQLRPLVSCCNFYLLRLTCCRYYKQKYGSGGGRNRQQSGEGKWLFVSPSTREFHTQLSMKVSITSRMTAFCKSQSFDC